MEVLQLPTWNNRPVFLWGLGEKHVGNLSCRTQDGQFNSRGHAATRNISQNVG